MTRTATELHGAQQCGRLVRVIRSPCSQISGLWHVDLIDTAPLQTLTQSAYGYANDWGVFYGGQGFQLGMQVLGVVVIAAWTCALNGALFLLLRKVRVGD